MTSSVRSRIFRVFEAEENFLEAIRRAVLTFAHELHVDPGGIISLKVPGHSAVLRRVRRKPRWRGKMENYAKYEPSVTAVMSLLLRTFDIRTVYDVGASRGYFSLLAASTENRPATVHAFEMRPSAHGKLVERLETEPDIRTYLTAHLCGMSDHHEGERDIWFSRTRMFEQEPPPEAYREPWWLRLKFLLRGIRDRDQLVRARVLMTSLDHFAAKTGDVPDLIKIDVDGYEALVVPGAMQTLSGARPFLLLELHKDEFLRRFGVTRQDVVRPLFELGYSAVLLADHNRTASNLIKIGLGDSAIARQETSMFLFY